MTTAASSGTGDDASTGSATSTTDDDGSESGSGSGSESSGSTGESCEGGPPPLCFDGGEIPEIGYGNACDPYAQDCPGGQRCTYWSDGGGPVLNATRCSPVDPNPAQAGDVCDVVGSILTGLDDCDIGTICHYADRTGSGACVPIPSGSPDNPQCADPATTPALFHGFGAICVQSCDPIAQDCVIGSCMLTEGRWACLDNYEGNSGPGGGVPCGHSAACSDGYACSAGDCYEVCSGMADCSCSLMCAPLPGDEDFGLLL